MKTVCNVLTVTLCNVEQFRLNFLQKQMILTQLPVQSDLTGMNKIIETRLIKKQYSSTAP